MGAEDSEEEDLEAVATEEEATEAEASAEVVTVAAAAVMADGGDFPEQKTSSVSGES